MYHHWVLGVFFSIEVWRGVFSGCGVGDCGYGCGSVGYGGVVVFVECVLTYEVFRINMYRFNFWANDVEARNAMHIIIFLCYLFNVCEIVLEWLLSENP